MSGSFGVPAVSLKSNDSTWLIAPEISKNSTLRALPRGWTLASVDAARSGHTASAEAASRPSPPSFSRSLRDWNKSATVLDSISLYSWRFARSAVSNILLIVKEELYLVDQRPLEVLGPLAAVLLERCHSDLFLGLRRAPGQGRQKHLVHDPVGILVAVEQPLHAAVLVGLHAVGDYRRLH